MEDFFRLKRAITPLESETVFSLFGFPINNSTITLFLLIAILVVASIVLFKKARVIPGVFQSVLEIFYEAVFGVVQQITGSKKAAERIFPLIGTLFVFILLSNLLGLVPGLSSISIAGTPLFRTPTSDFNTTFALAVAMVLFLQAVSISETSVRGYLGKFFQFAQVYRGFKEGISSGLIAVLNFFIGLLDIVSELAKVVSLSLRLFGNMFAGDVLAVVILGGVAYGLPALWMSMNLLAAVVQTMVFSFLITAYYTMSLAPKSSRSEEMQEDEIYIPATRIEGVIDNRELLTVK